MHDMPELKANQSAGLEELRKMCGAMYGNKYIEPWHRPFMIALLAVWRKAK